MIDRKAHRLRSAHRCICGWEGDDAITHIIDVLGLEPVNAYVNSAGSIVCDPPFSLPNADWEPIYRVSGGKGD